MLASSNLMRAATPLLWCFLLLAPAISLAGSHGCKGSASAGQPSTSAAATQPAGSTISPASASVKPSPLAVPVPDRGVFSDLDEKVRVQPPSWLAPTLVGVSSGRPSILYVDGIPVAFSQGSSGVGIKDPNDADGDSIPDQLDILVGAKKTVLNADAYRSTYRVIPYPGGDIPRTEGVCTDVIVRSLRNAGYDLQKLIHEDIRSSPSRYSHVKSPDRSIDHRRVRNLLPFFKRHWVSLPTDPSDTAVPFVPGDICLMDTMGGPDPEHIGIVSDTLAPSGFPLIINNWTDGYHTSEMDLLSFVPVTHRFRVSPQPLELEAGHGGLTGLLGRNGLSIPSSSRQLLLVTVPVWGSSGGKLQRYQRSDAGAAFSPVGPAIKVRVGAKGLGIGRGVHGASMAGKGPVKQEGDLRSPAGVFKLGTAFGVKAASFKWPFRIVDENDFFVDDPGSPNYNQWWRDEPGKPRTFASAESLSTYRMGIVVEHNMGPAVAGSGSAIFLHGWADEKTPTTGCTATSDSDLKDLLDWLLPEANPLLVQLAGRSL